MDLAILPELESIGREYFARAPESKIWVSFGDLPQATRDRLWEKHKSELAFLFDLESAFAKTEIILEATSPIDG